MDKVVHYARFVSSFGGVSPICFKTPRSLNIHKVTWTIRKDAVTCPRCKAQLIKDDNNG